MQQLCRHLSGNQKQSYDRETGNFKDELREPGRDYGSGNDLSLQPAGSHQHAINGDVLTLYDLTGKTLLTYQKAGTTVTPVPIAGITWKLDLYRQSSGSDMPVIQDTEVTALFGPVGNLTGSAGCNSYTGIFTTSGSNGISIGPLATTLMYCGEPGVMDQETAYLTLLRTASSYVVTADGMLNIKNSAGTQVLVYSS
jgi:heat shock protein HslJ